MDVNKKPFVCSGQGCKKEFATEDHLNVHMKKHNLALSCSTDCQNVSGADQTPTPTRFIRNCEELGLFQDLQNVNPFEETFRKATEVVTAGSSLLPVKTEETLHTPHVLSEPKNVCVVKKEYLNAPSAKGVNQFLECIPFDIPPPITVVKSNIIEDEIDAKDISLKNQGSRRADNNRLHHYNSDSSDSSSEGQLRIVSDKSECDPVHSRERQRELNRLAQVRCRARKKYKSDQLLDDLSRLRKDKKSLLTENKSLKAKLMYLQAVLFFHKDCPVSKDPMIEDKVKKLIKVSKEKLKEQTGFKNNNKVFKRILPSTCISSMRPSSILSTAPQTSQLSNYGKLPESVVNQTNNSSNIMTVKGGSERFVVFQPLILHNSVLAACRSSHSSKETT